MQAHYASHPPIGLCHPLMTRSGFYAAIQTYLIAMGSRVASLHRRFGFRRISDADARC